ncbi:hypothetical protein, partial [Escherichia coli]|nr:hypothetical protein [Escherichia coli]
EGWAILLRQKQKKLIMLPSETMIWQPEFTDKTLSRKPGAVQSVIPKSLKLKQSNRLLIAVILLPALQHVSISPPTAFTPG